MHSTCEHVRAIAGENQHGGKKCGQEKNQFHRPESQNDVLTREGAYAQGGRNGEANSGQGRAKNDIQRALEAVLQRSLTYRNMKS